MSVIVELALFPLDKGEEVGRYVAKALEVIQDSNLAYELHPMGTSIEGEWDQVLEVIKHCHDRLRQESDRVYLTLQVDSRSGSQPRLRQKVDTVESYLKD
jgi:uncharacterized protein (TIGR00106 family)